MISTIQEKTQIAQGLIPLLRTPATYNGTGISRLTDAKNELLVILNIGAFVATGTLDVKIQECATVGGVYTDVPSGAFAQKLAASAANTISELFIDLDKVARLEFIRVNAVVGTADCTFSVGFVLGKARVLPA